MRVIEHLRRMYPDPEFSWRWSEEHRIWVNMYLGYWVRAESISRGCCGDSGCDHYSTQFRLHMEYYGPHQRDHEWHPDYSEVIPIMRGVGWMGSF